MSNDLLPTLFISHGAPTMPLENIPARAFLMELGGQYRNAKAVLCISAHWETPRPAVNSTYDEMETIHDFYGFPSELYKIKYPAHGSPELAEHVADLLRDAGMPCDIDRKRGLDHGAWVPMMLMFPRADMPVLQLSIQRGLDPTKHYALGQAINALREEDVLILGSGGAVHPLGYAPLGPGAATDQWAIEFDDWLTNAVNRGDKESLLNYKTSAPYPERAHPYPDHFMPLLAAFGAAGAGARGKVMHHSWHWGDLGMGAYEFKI
jgi:4,5-DOPA dioxygenase extradiol